MKRQWFDVDKSGLGKQAEEHGKGRLIGELVQNALDEAGVTRIDISVELVAGRPLADLTVEDDSPEGFRDLADAYTLFAKSYKRDNPEQRGQFNFGEKLVLAVCEAASDLHDQGHGHLRSRRGPHRKAPAEAGTRLRVPGTDQDDQGRISAGLRLPPISSPARWRGRDAQWRAAPAPQAPAHVRGQPGNGGGRRRRRNAATESARPR